MASPLEQFTIKPIVPLPLGKLDVSFTNSALMMTIAVAVIAGLLVFSVRSRDLVPGRLQSVAELGYEFIAGMVRENVGDEGRKYFPFVFSVFSFVLVGNLLGMLPGAFTFTSHIAVTFAMALTPWVLRTSKNTSRFQLRLIQLSTVNTPAVLTDIPEIMPGSCPSNSFHEREVAKRASPSMSEFTSTVFEPVCRGPSIKTVVVLETVTGVSPTFTKRF